uniref:Uncharacterized protein n=1 Tax=Romanomermis culicivorax TaxID=13658 RepID=A0A915J0L9_ROMCU
MLEKRKHQENGNVNKTEDTKNRSESKWAHIFIEENRVTTFQDSNICRQHGVGEVRMNVYFSFNKYFLPD